MSEQQLKSEKTNSNSLVESFYKKSLFPTNLGIPELATLIPSLKKSETGTLETQSFLRFPKETFYPPEIVESLTLILDEYTTAFHETTQLKQGDEVYLHARDESTKYVNFGFQIDMKGLSQEFIEEAKNYSPGDIADALKLGIFEIENSLAMYGMMRGVFSLENEYSPLSFFGVNFDAAIREWEEYHGKPIVLGTVTDGKFEAMLLSEFGTDIPNQLTKNYVRRLSGFSGFLSPVELRKLAYSGELDNFILYMRTSYPVFWLKNPQAEFPIPLLEDDNISGQIRRQAITFNVDDPREIAFLMANLEKFDFIFDKNKGAIFIPKEPIKKLGQMSVDDEYYIPHILNDTKEPLARMGIVYPFGKVEDLVDEEEYRDDRGKLQKRFRLKSGLTQSLTIKEEDDMRAKPLWLHYGGYGHVRGSVNNGDVRGEIRRNMKKRGPYVIQREINPAIFYNKDDGNEYAVIHRLFFAFDPRKNKFKFIGGLLDALPTDSWEVKRGRIHGNREAVWGQIVCTDQNLVVDPSSLNYIRE